jgi:hypothetical protein
MKTKKILISLFAAALAFAACNQPTIDMPSAAPLLTQTVI